MENTTACSSFKMSFFFLRKVGTESESREQKQTEEGKRGMGGESGGGKLTGEER